MSPAQPDAPDRPRARPSPIDWPRLTSLIRTYRRFVLTTHIRPDCDAVGSELAMATVLERLGKQASIVNPFELPPGFRFLDVRQRLMRLGTDAADLALQGMEVLMVLDTSAWAQLGAMGEVIKTAPAVKIVLDHHVTADDLPAELFQDPEVEATGRLVAEVAAQLGVPIDAEIAEPLFAALATDTGWFRFSSTTAETFRLAAELAARGADAPKIYRQLYENERVGRLVLLGRAMSRATTELDGRLIYAWLERADFQISGALPSDSEDLINLTLSVKVSFRSRSNLDCSRLAAKFGGGGHKAAAGVTLAEPLPMVRAKILDAVREAMQQ